MACDRRLRSRRASAGAVAALAGSVHPWTCVAIRIDRVAAPLARRSTGRDDRVGVTAQRCRLTACEEDAYMTAVLDSFRIGLALLVDGNDLLELDEDTIV